MIFLITRRPGVGQGVLGKNDRSRRGRRCASASWGMFVDALAWSKRIGA